MIDIAIVGLGSWGVCVLERVVNRATQTRQPIRVHAIEPGPVGGAAYDARQPDYLVLNNACGQLSLYATPDLDRPTPRYGLGLYEWATSRGYRWVDDSCRIGCGGTPVTPGDYLPRRVMGEYLDWFYRTVIEERPENLEVIRYSCAVDDIVAESAETERLTLSDGRAIVVDHVVLTSGHTPNREGTEPGFRPLSPYPIDQLQQLLGPGDQVAVSGMGLVAFDVIAALTTARGGRFVDVGDRKLYRPSGREPVINLYSRYGVAHCAKSVTATDPTGDYQPLVCTREALAAIRGTADGELARRPVDLRSELLPMLFAEMQSRYYVQSVQNASGSAAAQRVRARLRDAWERNAFDDAVRGLSTRYGMFDAEAHLFAGRDQNYASEEDYQKHLYTMISDDLDEALMNPVSPVKAAQEVLRILRDDIRSVIEFGGLSLESYIDFTRNIRGRVNRLEAGPPLMRSQQLLALMDAGVVRAPFGPSPELSTDSTGRPVLTSTRLDIGHSETMKAVVRGHLDMPSLAHTASPLLSRMYRIGRLTQLQYGDTAVGSVAISEEMHPFDIEGRLQSTISVLGVLTEGARYFTHYLPSPRSRIRAVLDAQACVDQIIARRAVMA